jgi:hypothetical protein
MEPAALPIGSAGLAAEVAEFSPPIGERSAKTSHGDSKETSGSVYSSSVRGALSQGPSGFLMSSGPVAYVGLGNSPAMRFAVPCDRNGTSYDR